MCLDFDNLVFDKLSDSLDDMFPEILAIFIDETATSIESLSDEIEKENWVCAKEIAHKLKSSAKTFGAMGLNKNFEKIEHLTSTVKQDFEVLNKKIKNEFNLVKKHIKNKAR